MRGSNTASMIASRNTVSNTGSNTGSNSLGYNFQGAGDVWLTTNAPLDQFTTLCELSNKMTVNPDSCGVITLKERGYNVKKL